MPVGWRKGPVEFHNHPSFSKLEGFCMVALAEKGRKRRNGEGGLAQDSLGWWKDEQPGGDI